MSPLRLNVIMCAWVAFMHIRVPELETAACLDDRVLWITGDHCGEILKEVAQANREFELAFHLKDNFKKRMWFANLQATRAELRKNLDGALVVASVQILGITYELGKRTAAHDGSAAMATLQSRARRIAIAGGSFQERKALVQLTQIGVDRAVA